MSEQSKKGEADLLKSIESLKESYKLSDIEELVIEDIYIERITERVRVKLEELKHLESLQLNRCQLLTLDNLPFLPSIVRVTLDHNKIPGSELVKLQMYENLISLSIMDNKIDNLEDFAKLQPLQNLVQLNIFGNPIANSLKFRTPIFDKLPKLEFLDNLNRNGQEITIEGDNSKNKNGESRGKKGGGRRGGVKKELLEEDDLVQDDAGNEQNSNSDFELGRKQVKPN